MTTRRSTRIETHNLNAYPSREAAWQVLLQIKPVHDACWRDADLEAIYASRLDPMSELNRLILARDAGGAVVGFGHSIVKDVDVADTPVRLMRFVTGVLPEWRTTAAGLERLTLGPFTLAAVRGLLRGRLPVVFLYLGTPTAYRTVLRLSPRVIPSPQQTPDPTLLRLRDALITYVQLERIPGRAHACYGPRLAIPPTQRAFWQQHTAPEVQFFLHHCPGFGEGEFLPAVIPVTWHDIAQVPFRFATGLAREWLRRQRRGHFRSRDTADSE